jgi:hypothetical protein
MKVFLAVIWMGMKHGFETLCTNLNNQRCFTSPDHGWILQSDVSCLPSSG